MRISFLQYIVSPFFLLTRMMHYTFTNYKLFTFKEHLFLHITIWLKMEWFQNHGGISKIPFKLQGNLQNITIIGNHGGSPPILGLKRDHPRAWGTRFNRMHIS